MFTRYVAFLSEGASLGKDDYADSISLKSLQKDIQGHVNKDWVASRDAVYKDEHYIKVFPVAINAKGEFTTVACTYNSITGATAFTVTLGPMSDDTLSRIPPAMRGARKFVDTRRGLSARELYDNALLEARRWIKSLSTSAQEEVGSHAKAYEWRQSIAGLPAAVPLTDDQVLDAVPKSLMHQVLEEYFVPGDQTRILGQSPTGMAGTIPAGINPPTVVDVTNPTGPKLATAVTLGGPWIDTSPAAPSKATAPMEYGYWVYYKLVVRGLPITLRANWMTSQMQYFLGHVNVDTNGIPDFSKDASGNIVMNHRVDPAGTIYIPIGEGWAVTPGGAAVVFDMMESAKAGLESTVPAVIEPVTGVEVPAASIVEEGSDIGQVDWYEIDPKTQAFANPSAMQVTSTFKLEVQPSLLAPGTQSSFRMRLRQDLGGTGAATVHLDIQCPAPGSTGGTTFAWRDTGITFAASTYRGKQLKLALDTVSEGFARVGEYLAGAIDAGVETLAMMEWDPVTKKWVPWVDGFAAGTLPLAACVHYLAGDGLGNRALCAGNPRTPYLDPAVVDTRHDAWATLPSETPYTESADLAAHGLGNGIAGVIWKPSNRHYFTCLLPTATYAEGTLNIVAEAGYSPPYTPATAERAFDMLSDWDGALKLANLARLCKPVNAKISDGSTGFEAKAHDGIDGKPKRITYKKQLEYLSFDACNGIDTSQDGWYDALIARRDALLATAAPGHVPGGQFKFSQGQPFSWETDVPVASLVGVRVRLSLTPGKGRLADDHVVAGFVQFTSPTGWSYTADYTELGTDGTYNPCFHGKHALATLLATLRTVAPLLDAALVELEPAPLSAYANNAAAGKIVLPFRVRLDGQASPQQLAYFVIEVDAQSGVEKITVKFAASGRYAQEAYAYDLASDMTCFPFVPIKKKDEYGWPLPETVWMHQPVYHPTFHEWIRQDPDRGNNVPGFDITPFLRPVHFIAYMRYMSSRPEYQTSPPSFPMYPAIYL